MKQVIESLYRKLFLGNFANGKQRKSQKLNRELFLITDDLWNTIRENLLPRNLINSHAIRIPDSLLVIGSSALHGLGGGGGPSGKNSKKHPRDAA